MELRPGDIFLGEYTISHLIGEGGFSRVYRAEQRRLGRDVAIKLLQNTSEASRKRYTVEAKVVARLQHPATVRVYDFGEEDETPYMVLEFLQGRTLRRVMDWQSPFAPERAVNIMLQILGSVAEAHALGVVHRDLKPSNIMLFQPNPSLAYDQVKVLDFGLAKLTPLMQDGFITNPGRLTEQGTTVGTLQYMPPEQMRGQKIVPASDLFSIGMMGFEMLVGKHPYPDAKGMELAVKMAEPTPILIPEEAGVSPGLSTVIHRLLQKDADDRYQRAEDVIADLEELNEATIEIGAAGIPEGPPGWYSEPAGHSYVSLLPPPSGESDVLAEVDQILDAPRRETTGEVHPPKRPAQDAAHETLPSEAAGGEQSRRRLLTLAGAFAVVVLLLWVLASALVL